jgi:putative endonuclease
LPPCHSRESGNPGPEVPETSPAKETNKTIHPWTPDQARGDGHHVFPAYAGIHRSNRGKMADHSKNPAVYILSNRKNGTLYIGVTSDLIKRIYEHRTHAVEGFTKRYGVERLVYYELHSSMEEAILREKRLKKWRRKWKVELIESFNPEWEDLYNTLYG